MRSCCLTILLWVISLHAWTADAPPTTDSRPVEDRYGSARVIDAYRWLEDDSPPASVWVQRQNSYARSVLDALPDRAAIRSAMKDLQFGQDVAYFDLSWRGNSYFALKQAPPKEQPLLVALADPDDLSSEHPVVDPNAMDERGGTSINWYNPSPDGRFVAVSISSDNSERGNVHVFDAASGKPLADIVQRVHYATAGGSLAWLADSSGFLYTHYPRPGERPTADEDFYQQVYSHRLGTPTSQDRYELGKTFPRIAETQLSAGRDGWLFARVTNGDQRRYRFYARSPDGRWSQFISENDQISQVAPTDGHALLLLSLKAARGEVLKLNLLASRPDEIRKAALFAPEPAKAAITRILTARAEIGSDVYLIEANGGPEQVAIYSVQGQPKGFLPLPPVSALNDYVLTDDGNAIFCVSSYQAANRCYRQNEPQRPLAISETSTVNLSDLDVIRETAISKDGTRVPMTILHRRGLPLRPDTPTIMTGYGEFNGERPGFDPNERISLDAGVTWVDTNIRGGSDYGMAWHRDGELLNKQHSFDDFIACAERLIELGYTSPAHLVIEGSSAGGLLMGAAMTQRPDLFKAVAANVGIYDMLRVERESNGQFNTTQYGTVRIPKQFQALYAYSPYHHVIDGVRYPDALLLTGATDAHVSPMHSRKMVARLQAVANGQSLILLRTSATDGHGLNTAFSEEIEQEADILSFEFSELGVRYPAIAPPH